MAVTFPNLEFPGTHEAPMPEPTSLHTVRTRFAGLDGEIELILGRGGRKISINIVVHGTGLASEGAVQSLLDKYDRGVGYHGDLKVGTRDFKNCTFEGFTQVESILPDVGNTLNRGAGGTSYFVRGTLHFHQLSVEGT